MIIAYRGITTEKETSWNLEISDFFARAPVTKSTFDRVGEVSQGIARVS